MELKGLCSLNIFVLESITALALSLHSWTAWNAVGWTKRCLGRWALLSFFLLPPLLGISLGNQSLHGLQADMCNHHYRPLYGKVWTWCKEWRWSHVWFNSSSPVFIYHRNPLEDKKRSYRLFGQKAWFVWSVNTLILWKNFQMHTPSRSLELTYNTTYWYMI